MHHGAKGEMVSAGELRVELVLRQRHERRGPLTGDAMPAKRQRQAVRQRLAFRGWADNRDESHEPEHPTEVSHAPTLQNLCVNVKCLFRNNHRNTLSLREREVFVPERNWVFRNMFRNPQSQTTQSLGENRTEQISRVPAIVPW
jgi:hypothetical protein